MGTMREKSCLDDALGAFFGAKLGITAQTPRMTPTGDSGHDTGGFHFKADKVIHIPYFISFLSVLHQLIPGSDSAVPHFGAFFGKSLLSHIESDRRATLLGKY